MIGRSTLAPRDFSNLRYALSLDKVQFQAFYDELDDYDQKYLSALLETHRLDILDFAFETGDIPKPNVEELINKIK